MPSNHQQTVLARAPSDVIRCHFLRRWFWGGAGKKAQWEKILEVTGQWWDGCNVSIKAQICKKQSKKPPTCSEQQIKKRASVDFAYCNRSQKGSLYWHSFYLAAHLQDLSVACRYQRGDYGAGWQTFQSLTFHHTRIEKKSQTEAVLFALQNPCLWKFRMEPRMHRDTKVFIASQITDESWFWILILFFQQ